MIRIVLLLALYLIVIGARAGNVNTDTLHLTLPELEGIFLKNNLSLLAAKFEIEATKAEILQSKLWSNPSIYLEQNIYNKYTHKAFDATRTGQNIVQVQQLFLLAGKRNKRVQLSTINSQIAEYQFFDLLRTLKYELRSAFYDTYFKIQIVKMYDEEIESLNRTLDIFEILIKKGAISMKEIIRIKSLLFTLESERLEVLGLIHENQTSLNVLLNLTPNQFIDPQVDVARLDSLSTVPIDMAALQDTALLNRLDLKTYEASVKYQEADLAYQRALAVPDVRVGGVYDKAGSYIPNYTGVSVSIDLPVWNRNQGNISAAKSRREQSLAQYNQHRQQVVTEVSEAYRKILQTIRVYKTIDKSIGTEFEKLMDIIILNYEKRNISLIEFMDYYQAYKTTMLETNRIRNDKIQAMEELNYYTGKSIIEF